MITENTLSVLLFILTGAALLLGYPVAFTLSSVALLIAGLGSLIGLFDLALLNALPSRLFGIISNQTLLAVPLFVFMGVMLEKTKIAQSLLESMTDLIGHSKSGIGLAVIFVGLLLAASTGIVGATVVTLGLLALPSLIKRGYDTQLACGIVCATGTLGQIIPPSIALVLLSDVLSSAYQQAQLSLGNFAPEPLSVGDLFVGALIPGLVLVMLYMLYVIYATFSKSNSIETNINTQALSTNSLTSHQRLKLLLGSFLPPLLLITVVLGSILAGLATPTEAAGVGAFGATLLGLINKKLTAAQLSEVCQETAKVTSMVFMILIGASIFSLVFRGLGGEEFITHGFNQLPGGTMTALWIVMLIIFLLGFVLDFIEITYVVIPIVGPILLAMGIDPVWLGIMIAVNLQTSFLTPPFGFALFYFRGIAPNEIATTTIYRGVVPFIVLQLLLMVLLCWWPSLATWLPSKLYG